MTEPKDASTCDERRVKNKLNSLTKKKEGETRTMFNKDMKTWKLGAFFVISLMLVAGLFGDTAQAQTVTVTTNPSDVVSQGILRSVAFTYEADADIVTINEIVFDLPIGWDAAYTDRGASGSSFGTFLPDTLNVIGETGAPAVRQGTSLSTLVDGATRSDASYVEVVYIRASGSLADKVTVDINNNGVTVTVPAVPTDDPPIPATEGTKVGDRVVVTYYNVQVPVLVATATLNDMGEFEASVPIMIGGTAVATPPMINVRYRHPSTIEVSTAPSALKPLVVAHVTVRYKVQEPVIGPNAVTIELPTRWAAAYRSSESEDTADNRGFGPEILTKRPRLLAGDMRSYVVLTTTLGTMPETTGTPGTTGTPASLVNGELALEDQSSRATITAFVPTVPTDATASMQRNDLIALTYYNVQVRQLEEYQLTANRDPVSYDLTVTDSIVGAGKAATDAYMPAPVVMVRPPKLSDVAVTPTPVDGGTKRDVTVTYTAKDMIYGINTVSVELPSLWEPAYLPQDGTRNVNSFGAAALLPTDRVPSSDRNSTSYVVLSTKVTSDTSAEDLNDTVKVTSALLFDIANARLEVTVPGGMVNNDYIKVVFHNVKVEELIDTDHKDAALVIEDSIVGSSYAKTIEVIPPKLGNVTVTPDPVTAEATVDLTVRYTATQVLADDNTYGRIRVELPAGWTHSEDYDEIFTERPVGKSDATYLSLAKSSGVTLAKTIGNPDGLTPVTEKGDQTDGWIIDIDVDKMTTRHQVTLTVHNLKIDALMEPRSNRHTDLTAAMTVDKVQVMVSSGTYPSTSRGKPAHSPATFRPKVAEAGDVGSDTQPTITVNRKTQGEVTVAPVSVTAGDKQDFTITYKATEAMIEGDVIEVKLPADWFAPTVYQLDEDKPTDEQDNSYVYLSGSATRLEGTLITVIDGGGAEAEAGAEDSDGWIVQIELGTRGASKNSTIVLKYNDVTVQRSLATGDDKLVVETFSGPAPAGDLPQFPVVKLAEDTIEVKHAADGSGKVTFMYEGNPVTSMAGKDSADPPVALVSNTNVSIPAGLIKGDLSELVVTYTPDGDMGAGEFELRLPSDWEAEDVRVYAHPLEVWDAKPAPPHEVTRGLAYLRSRANACHRTAG